ncbi:MAG: hypothetical protein K7J15_05035 [Candidatus Regiella insecticola]|nr:hypothetical protein [Candidatus Regiella insecticola]
MTTQNGLPNSGDSYYYYYYYYYYYFKEDFLFQTIFNLPVNSHI